MAEILLESGTNELELLEFKVGGNFYGINVAKIKEILPYQKPTPVPNSHPGIEGIFMPRNELITLVDLAKLLNLPPSDKIDTDMFIVTRFNSLTIAFHVHSVEGIHRVSWNDINKPDDTINNSNSIATGIIKIEDKLLIILDFEKIISDISPETGLRVSDVEKFKRSDRIDKHILMAEDSALLAKLIKSSLEKAGYSNITQKSDGLDAWEYIEDYLEKGKIDDIKCVITDIEMPKMDGHRLTKLIKSNKETREIPVVIFSSLVDDRMRDKGRRLGADAQLSKPEIGDLVATVDDLLLND